MTDDSIPGPHVRMRFAGTHRRHAPGRRRRPACRRSSRPCTGAHTLDREIAEIKDNVLRMGTPRRGARSAPRSTPSRRTTPTLALAGHHRRPPDQRGPAQGDGDDRRDDRHPAAGRPRPALPADARPRGYELERMGDHASSVAKQARKLAPTPPHRGHASLPILGERCRATSSHGMHPGARRHGRGAGPRGGRARRPGRRRSTTRSSTEVLELMRADPANVEPGDADPVRGRTTSSASATA